MCKSRQTMGNYKLRSSSPHHFAFSLRLRVLPAKKIQPQHQLSSDKRVFLHFLCGSAALRALPKPANADHLSSLRQNLPRTAQLPRAPHATPGAKLPLNRRRRISSRSSRSSRDKKSNRSISSHPTGASFCIFFAALRLCARFQQPPNVDHLSSLLQNLPLACEQLPARSSNSRHEVPTPAAEPHLPGAQRRSPTPCKLSIPNAILAPFSRVFTRIYIIKSQWISENRGIMYIHANLAS